VNAEAESAYAKERIQQNEGPISEEGLLVFSEFSLFGICL
jgi:hypothetical protein